MKTVQAASVVLASLIFSSPVQAGDFSADAPLDFELVNPCTQEMVVVDGTAHLNGQLQDVDGGYRFQGEINYADVKAHNKSGDKSYTVTGDGVGKEQLSLKVDVPVNKEFTTWVRFIGPAQQDNFRAALKTRISYSLFGGKDVEVLEARPECPTNQ